MEISVRSHTPFPENVRVERWHILKPSDVVFTSTFFKLPVFKEKFKTKIFCRASMQFSHGKVSY